MKGLTSSEQKNMILKKENEEYFEPEKLLSLEHNFVKNKQQNECLVFQRNNFSHITQKLSNQIYQGLPEKK